ncbi:Transcription initiation factor TFIID subunit 2 [Mycena venus]|uniref:Transcription initiation factor TFIID subunit 2 n=1 Tax=Mycena venus TaxID=2733690 RepID=A0A8H7CT97_9AGAR|nr:Transcription initiation factor TFIID subunit 2 [Mycena venus]
MFSREGNYTQVRIAAFDGLFTTKWYTPPIMNYVLAVMAHDPSRAVRQHVARNACQSLALLVQMGEMKLNSKDPESLLIEEDGSIPDKNKESRKSEMDTMIKALRKDKEVGKNEVFRELMMPLALAADVDHEVRWCLLKLADLLIKPIEETAPTVKIHIPITPVTENPPILTPSLPAKPRVKLAGPVQSPVVPNHVPKLKLRASTPTVVRTPARTPSVEPQAKPVVFAVPALPPKAKPAPVPKAKPPKTKWGPQTRSCFEGTGVGNDIERSSGHSVSLEEIARSQAREDFSVPCGPHPRPRAQVPTSMSSKSRWICNRWRTNSSRGKYADRFAFQADFRLMMANAKSYNPVGSFAHDETLALETYFEKQWTIINKTLEAAHAKEAQKPPKVLPPVPQAFPDPPAPQPTPSTSRQTIKLKQSQPKEAAPKPVLKQPKRKPRVELPPAEPPADPPPPPYVDDGSHDILQEVLALERITNGKRKKVEISEEEDEAEDDLLALATPAKKNRPSPPEPSSSSVAVPKIVLKSKPPVDPPVSRPSSVDVPRISIKGKEKEVAVANGPPAHRSKKSPVAQATPIDEKKCKQLLSMLMKLPESAIFLRPVDPVLDGCPTYFDEIAHPMDFGTISANLASHSYETMEKLRKDINLVFSNCKTFNPPATFPWDCADAVEKVFKKEWPKVMEKKLSLNEKRGLQGILTTLGKEEISWVFREPVDPVLLQIPTYFDIIKHPRDLHTIRNWLNSDKYETVEAFEADIQLMVDNAITFNGLESDVGALATGLRDRFRELLKNWKAGANKKRKDGEKANSQPTKKIKIG